MAVRTLISVVELDSIDVGLSPSEPEPLIEQVRLGSFRSAGQVDTAGTCFFGEFYSGLHERGPDATTTRGFIDDDIFDPRAHPRRDVKCRERAHADYSTPLSSGQQRRGRRCDDLSKGFGIGVSGARQLGQQAFVCLNHLIVHNGDLLNHRFEVHVENDS
jgi:hypothetical protein